MRGELVDFDRNSLSIFLAQIFDIPPLGKFGLSFGSKRPKKIGAGRGLGMNPDPPGSLRCPGKREPKVWEMHGFNHGVHQGGISIYCYSVDRIFVVLFVTFRVQSAQYPYPEYGQKMIHFPGRCTGNKLMIRMGTMPF